jgi:predicted HicB family RNase H-like nuclease
MVRPKARKTKGSTLSVRLEDAVKKPLQEYADSQGISLSQLVQKTLGELAGIVRAQKLAQIQLIQDQKKQH